MRKDDTLSHDWSNDKDKVPREGATLTQTWVFPCGRPLRRRATLIHELPNDKDKVYTQP